LPETAVADFGPGGVFHGAFCYAVFEKMPVCEALEFLNAMAALNYTARGERRRHAGFAARAGRS
jgi:sugar/nucleoside kinase (ribokinase family)